MEAREIAYVLPIDAWAALAALQGATSFWVSEDQGAPNAAKGWAWLLEAELVLETPEHVLVEPALSALAKRMAQVQEVLCFQRGQRTVRLFAHEDFAATWEGLAGDMVQVTPFPSVQAALTSVAERFWPQQGEGAEGAKVRALCCGREGTVWERQLDQEALRALQETEGR